MLLKRGMQSADVGNFQRVLGQFIGGLDPDGDYGAKTEAAVKAFQSENGLVADGIVGPKTIETLDALFQPTVDNFTSSGELSLEDEIDVVTNDDLKKHKRLVGCDPRLQERVLKMVDLAAAEGHTLRVSSGVRTKEEQDVLYAKGRTTPGPRVTGARGLQSNHNFGVAADLFFIVNGRGSWDHKLMNKIGLWAVKCDLEWGGHWQRFVDKPHVQLEGIKGYKPLRSAYLKAGGGEAGMKAAQALVK